MKLTPIQKKVVSILQDEGLLFTDNTVKGAEVCDKNNKTFHINNGVFWRLVNKGVIGQQLQYPFHYELTPIGEKIKVC